MISILIVERVLHIHFTVEHMLTIVQIQRCLIGRCTEATLQV